MTLTPADRALAASIAAAHPLEAAWRIEGEQSVFCGPQNADIIITIGEAKMLRRAGAIAQSEEVGRWYIRDGYDGDSINDILYDAAQEAAEDRELRGTPEDSPSLSNCDDAGTGEGRYHGRM